MKLEITIGSQQLTFLAIFLIALAFMGLVVAYGGSQPSVMGHSAGELDLAPLYISGGNVGIGTTNPGEKLTVTGTIESTTGGVKFPDGTLQTTASRAPAIEVIDGSHNVQYNRNHIGYVKIEFTHVCWADAGSLTIKFKVDDIVQKQFTVNTNYITVPSPTFVYYGQKSGDFTFKLEASQSGGLYIPLYTQFVVTKY